MLQELKCLNGFSQIPNSSLTYNIAKVFTANYTHIKVQFSGINYIHTMCNHHQPLFQKMFIMPNKNSLPFLNSNFPFSPSPQSLETSNLLPVNLPVLDSFLKVESYSICPFVSGLFHLM